MGYSANSSNTDKKSLVQSKVSEAGEYVRASGQVIGESVSDSVESLANLPISVTTSVRNFGESLKKPKDSNLVEHLGKITGVESLQNLPNGFSDSGRFINDVIKEGTGIDLGIDRAQNIFKKPTLNAFKQKLAGTFSVLSDQVKAEMLGCIEAKLNKLRNKLDNLIQIPGINALDPSILARQLIAKHRIDLQRKIGRYIDDLKYRKIKIQQIVLFRQKITQAINDICKDAPPSARRKFQVNNFLKKVQDRVEENRSYVVHTGIQKAKTTLAANTVPVKNPVKGKIEKAVDKLYVRSKQALPAPDLAKNGYTDTLAASKTVDVNAELEAEALSQSQGYLLKYIGEYDSQV